MQKSRFALFTPQNSRGESHLKIQIKNQGFRFAGNPVCYPSVLQSEADRQRKMVARIHSVIGVGNYLVGIDLKAAF